MDFQDFIPFALKFGRERGHTGFEGNFDLDGDGRISFADFVLFALAFGVEPVRST